MAPDVAAPARPSLTAPPLITTPDRVRLGRGRSGEVYREEAEAGDHIACKVLVPDRASSLVNTVLTGAVNPYRWDPAAVESAVLRRRILERLVPWWFDDRVRLPRTHGSRWSDDARAFELRTELIDGRHAMLRHPDSGAAGTEVRELLDTVLGPLQAHLVEAGFDGMLWQAGRGNPVATANFMRLTGPGARWIWVDTESGVPAIFSPNPWHQLRTYLPLCLKHRRWVFDDIDVDRLTRYIDEHRGELGTRLGRRGLAGLCRDVEALRASQARWRASSRHLRSVTSHEALGDITSEEAEHYRARPVRWIGQLLWRACARVPARAARAVRELLPRLAPRRLAATVRRWARFFASHATRERWARRYVRRRVDEWSGRGFLGPDQERAVRRSLHGTDEAAYVADFAVHLAIKPGVKLLTWVVAPLLYLWGVIDSGALVAAMAVYGGAVARTLYTLGRCVQSLARRRPAPWVALGTGLLPVVGIAAFPLQMLTATKGRHGRVARFLVHDIFSGVGRRFPVWGGRDTLLEHRANALASVITRA